MLVLIHFVHTIMNFKEEYKKRFNAPMFSDLTTRELIIYRTGLKNGVSLGRRSVIPKTIIIKPRNKPIGPVINEDKRVNQILDTVSKYFKVSAAEVIGKCRKRYLVRPRSMVINLMRECTSLSYPDLAHILNKDHTTLIYHTEIKRLNKGVWLDNNLHNIFGTLKKEVCNETQ